MIADVAIEALITNLRHTVDRGLKYFEGPGTQSEVRIEDWGPREILCHMVVWHKFTVDGMESVLSGRGPTQLTASTDEINANAVKACKDQRVTQLAAKIRDLQTRMEAAARNLPDPDDAVLVRSNGTASSSKERLELITVHWNEHLDEVRA